MSRWFNSKRKFFAAASAAALSAFLLVTACSGDDDKDKGKEEQGTGLFCCWPVEADGSGGCHPIGPEQAQHGGKTTEAECTDDYGVVQDNDKPPTATYCDYGFGNIVLGTCNEWGAPAASLTTPSADGFYCDFGNVTQYGNGGCYFRPNLAAANNPDNGYNAAGDCDMWSVRVTMEECVASNTENPCVDDPLNPGDGSADEFCNPYM